MVKKPSRPIQAPKHAWLDNRGVLAVLGVLSLLLAYVFAGWAIDSGSLVDYAITFLLLVVGVRDLWVAVRKRK